MTGPLMLDRHVRDLTVEYQDGAHKGRGLLLELQDPTGRVFASRGGGVPGVAKPGSRPPVDVGHTDLLRLVEQRTYSHEADLLTVISADAIRPWNTWVDLHRPTWVMTLSRLPRLALHVHPDYTDRVQDLARDCEKWRRTARHLLGYVGPVQADSTCPGCEQGTYVTAGGPTDSGYCTRSTCSLAWANAQPDGDELLDSAMVCAALGIQPATLRDWKRQHLISPAGGTERKPLWRVADLLVAQRAPKRRNTRETTDA